MPRPPKPDSFLWKVFYRLTDVHKGVFRMTKGRIGGRVPGLGTHILILHHVGAKSGTARSIPLQYIPLGDEIAVIASKGGNARHPAWYHNLKANPDTLVELPGGEKRPVHARQVEGDERARWWARALEEYPMYDDYQSYTDRQIPVLVLDRR